MLSLHVETPEVQFINSKIINKGKQAGNSQLYTTAHLLTTIFLPSNDECSMISELFRLALLCAHIQIGGAEVFFSRKRAAAHSCVSRRNNWTHFQGHIDVIHLFARKTRKQQARTARSSTFTLSGSRFCFTLFTTVAFLAFLSLSLSRFVLFTMIKKEEDHRRRRHVWWF